MSIASELTKLKQNKESIKSALENKLLVDNISSKLSDWPSLISSINSVNIPENPDLEQEEEELITDEYTHIWFLPTSNSNVLSFQINITGETTIDWGDGTSPDILTTPGLLFATHVYSTIPTATASNGGKGCINYAIIEIKVYSEFDYTFEGQGATPDASMTKTSIPAFNTIANTIIKLIASENCTIGSWGLAACNSLKKFVLSSKQTILYPSSLAYFRGMTKIVVPEQITTINSCFGQSTGINEIILHNNVQRIEAGTFSGLSINKLELPSSVEYIGSSVCNNCKQLQEVVWKSPYKFIPSSALSGCYNLQILDLSYASELMYFGTNINTTGTSGNIALIPNQTKIIIPKSLYNSWKSNAKWIFFKNYLYWRDENGNLQNSEII